MIRRFNRYEIKYAVPVASLPTLKADLERFLGRDPHGGKHGFYSIASLYFDTPDLDCYRNKLDGLLFRRKLRIRIYPDQPGSDAFVEIKQRVNRTVQKRRLQLPLDAAYAMCSGDTRFELDDPIDQEVADEVHYLVTSLRLRPKNVIAYTRQAYVGHTVDPGMRLTFDTLVRTRRADFDLEQHQSMQLAFPAHLAIMEVKANERVPHWLTSLLARHQCTLTRVSKYCNGITAIGKRQESKRTVLGTRSS
ncbi:MAG: polyphosphate polymerase domain-containing protein [bacterium]|nr:polyphosphate polymerase domain-containing protein [bacterium]